VCGLVGSVTDMSAQDERWECVTTGQYSLKVTLVNPNALTWKDNPSIPKGAQVAVLLGDPTKTGDVIVQRVKLPAHYKVPPHTHPYAETITVLSGSVGFGTEEKFDATKGTMLQTGAFYAQPAKHPHYVWTGNKGTMVQVQFIGSGGIDYINPADDPRKK
jgi:quercetin dioxygenase-like cupin family protein